MTQEGGLPSPETPRHPRSILQEVGLPKPEMLIGESVFFLGDIPEEDKSENTLEDRIPGVKVIDFNANRYFDTDEELDLPEKSVDTIIAVGNPYMKDPLRSSEWSDFFAKVVKRMKDGGEIRIAKPFIDPNEPNVAYAIYALLKEQYDLDRNVRYKGVEDGYPYLWIRNLQPADIAADKAAKSN